MKSFNFVAGLLAIITISVFYRCECPECFTPPPELYFRIIDQKDSTDVLFKNGSAQSDLSFFYVENNSVKPLEFTILNDTIQNKTLFISGYPGFISASGIKEFYLKINESDTDTIFYDVEEQSDDCCTYFEEKEFKYNGKTIKKDKEFVYIVTK